MLAEEVPLASKQQYAAAVLKGIGAPVNPKNVNTFIGWANAEGGTNWQRNNPLNTTEGAGATSTFNSAGVKGYPTTRAGIQATVKTLKNGYYGGIIQGFRQSNPGAVGNAIANSPWGTGALAKQTIAAAQGGKVAPGLGSAGGGGGGGGVKLGPVQRSSQTFKTVQQKFDQAGYGQARAAYLAGSFLANSKNPFAPKGATSSGTSAGSSAAGLTPLFQRGLLTTTPPNISQFMSNVVTKQTIDSAHQSLQRLAGVGGKDIGGQGDVNPLPHVTHWERTDQGVDAALPVGAPILAPNTAKVIGIEPGWYAGQPFVYFQLLSGPNRGKIMYIAEQINDYPHVGAIVQRGHPIARFAPSGTGIEMGYATKAGQTLARATTGYTEGYATTAGDDFRRYLRSVGAKAGTGVGMSIGAHGGVDPDDVIGLKQQQRATRRRLTKPGQTVQPLIMPPSYYKAYERAVTRAAKRKGKDDDEE